MCPCLLPTLLTVVAGSADHLLLHCRRLVQRFFSVAPSPWQLISQLSLPLHENTADSTPEHVQLARAALAASIAQPSLLPLWGATHLLDLLQHMVIALCMITWLHDSGEAA